MHRPTLLLVPLLATLALPAGLQAQRARGSTSSTSTTAMRATARRAPKWRQAISQRVGTLSLTVRGDTGRFAETKSTIVQRIENAEGYYRMVKPETASGLTWTRRLMERPYSDWGLDGVGNVFKEKRSALINVGAAMGSIDQAKHYLSVLENEIDNSADSNNRGLTRRDRAWARQQRRAIELQEANIEQAREWLRGTSGIWREQSVLFMRGTTPEQMRIFEAFFTDRPEDAAIRTDHIVSYLRGKHGNSGAYRALEPGASADHNRIILLSDHR